MVDDRIKRMVVPWVGTLNIRNHDNVFSSADGRNGVLNASVSVARVKAVRTSRRIWKLRSPSFTGHNMGWEVGRDSPEVGRSRSYDTGGISTRSGNRRSPPPSVDVLCIRVQCSRRMSCGRTFNSLLLNWGHGLRSCSSRLLDCRKTAGDCSVWRPTPQTRDKPSGRQMQHEVKADKPGNKISLDATLNIYGSLHK